MLSLRSVVIAIAAPAHAGVHVVLVELLAEPLAGVLHAAVAGHNDSSGYVAVHA